MKNEEILLTGQEIIDQQKIIIGNLQHDLMVSKMMFEKLQKKLQEVQEIKNGELE